MISLDKAVTARLKIQGENFEILVDPDLAFKYKQDEIKDAGDAIASEFIFKDAKKAEKAAISNLQKVFKTEDVNVIAGEIIKKGEIELTTVQKRNMLEERKRQIIEYIVRNSMNPQTNAPNPPARIEAAIEQARVDIKFEKTTEQQIEGVLKKIREFVPIRFEKVKIVAKIPFQYAGGIHYTLKSIPILKEEYTSDSVLIMVEVPAGIQNDVLGKLSALTKGDVETKILK
ncbi:Ribosome maturation protein SDO1 homolog [groundwater metagenome]|uniref:Ribosome maturation protein SDO1 homolog n=1 Tax=groundwater metagenome TaxID=717931 RepID=A0A098E9W8_9ZZZZ